VVEHGNIDLAELLDVRGFNLNADLGGEPAPGEQGAVHRPHFQPGAAYRQAAGYRSLSEFMNELLEDHGKQLLRYKGVLNIAGEPRAWCFRAC
jgi:G3E family GTPase